VCIGGFFGHIQGRSIQDFLLFLGFFSPPPSILLSFVAALDHLSSVGDSSVLSFDLLFPNLLRFGCYLLSAPVTFEVIFRLS
jgi:hypothetical protein